MGVTPGSWRDKINELKGAISLARADYKTFAKFCTRLTKRVQWFKKRGYEEHATNLREVAKKDYVPILQQKYMIIDALNEELSTTRMNPNMSSAFEWIPSPPNRAYRRRMAKQRKR